MKTATATAKSTVCRACKGTRKVKSKGKMVTCVACRGTGKSGGYLTK